MAAARRAQPAMSSYGSWIFTDCRGCCHKKGMIEFPQINPFFLKLWIVAESPNNPHLRCITDLYGLRKVAPEVQLMICDNYSSSDRLWVETPLVTCPRTPS